MKADGLNSDFADHVVTLYKLGSGNQGGILLRADEVIE